MDSDQVIPGGITVRDLNRSTGLRHIVRDTLAQEAALFTRLPAGATVLLKPALHPDADGNPRCHTPLLLELARQLVESDYDVVVGDSPAVLPQDNADLYRSAGLDRLTEIGARVISFEQDGAVGVPVGTRTYYVARAALTADLVINLPVLQRVDRQMRQGALFNLLGILPGYHKMTHVNQSPFAELLGSLIVDLNAVISPRLTIMVMTQKDGVDLLIAGRDGAAIDSMVAKAAGLAPVSVPVLRQAADAGLGLIHPEAVSVRYLNVREEDPRVEVARRSVFAAVLKPFAANLVSPFLSVRPDVGSEECDACGDCVTTCPTGALTFEPGHKEPQLKSGLCIGCFSCGSCCHQKAITTKQSWLYRRLPDTWRRFCVE